MTQLEKFINNIFVALQEKFPNATIQYQQIIDTHFVKVTPSEIYNSEEFIDLDFEFNDKFDESDLEGMICFSTEGSLIELDNPTREYYPNINVSKVYLIEENIGWLNTFIHNDKSIFRSIEKSTISISENQLFFDNNNTYYPQAA